MSEPLVLELILTWIHVCLCACVRAGISRREARKHFREFIRNFRAGNLYPYRNPLLARYRYPSVCRMRLPLVTFFKLAVNAALPMTTAGRTLPLAQLLNHLLPLSNH